MIDIAANYAQVREQVAAVAQRCGRQPEAVTIVCAAKTKGPDAVRAALAAGATDIGENYVQEAQQKIAQVPEPARWHLIGHLQRNKARAATRLFTLIHSLDSVALAQELHRQGEKQGIGVRVLIEVNLGREHT
ncbi:MAG: alanine racemase, partial [Deltaproteobacteria bacterium]|nr:alanine racemase [Deltaproteobacteria bacterium]